MTGSGYLSASQDKMHSSYDSVQQQTGLFAGKGGYDISVGNHTQLDGAVIGSTASADKNRLDTGTLGFSNIDNRAEFSVSHSGIGLSASPSLSMSDMLKSAALTAPSALMSMGRGGNASSTTYAAVSDGALIIRNQAGQQQDIAGLSRDVEHANNALSPIFDKEKEQKRLQTAQMVGELGAQVMDVIRTEGEIRAVRAAEAKGDVKRPADNATEKEWDKYKKDLTETSDYKAVMQSYGTGSDLQRAAQAATAAIQALDAALATEDAARIGPALLTAFQRMEHAGLRDSFAAMTATRLRPEALEGTPAHLALWLRLWAGETEAMAAPADQLDAALLALATGGQPAPLTPALGALAPIFAAELPPEPDPADGIALAPALYGALADADAGTQGDITRSVRGVRMLRQLGLIADARRVATQIALDPLLKATAE